MATHKSALKRARQSVKRQARNKTRKSEIAALTKKLLSSPADEAQKLLSLVQKKGWQSQPQRHPPLENRGPQSFTPGEKIIQRTLERSSRNSFLATQAILMLPM